MKLLKFYADWCQPCKILGPQVKEFAEEHNIELVELNIEDENTDTAKYGVMSVPTCLLMDGETEIGRVIGLKPNSEFEKLITS